MSGGARTPPPDVLAAFGLEAAALGTSDLGHIHDTFVVESESGRWVVQRINTDVMGAAGPLMVNARLTSECLAAVGAGRLEYRATPTGDLVAELGGDAWRSYRFVEGSVVPRPDDPETARAIGHGFGVFDVALAAHDPASWHAVLPGYHDHHRRTDELRAAVENDAAGRLDGCVQDLRVIEALVERLEGHEGFAAWHEAPTRVAHHDAKGVNLVFGAAGRVTVLDLDTVMAGTVLSDIGELIRTCTRPAALGDPFDVDLAVATVEGFVSGWGLGLGPAEVVAVPVAGIMMSTQNAVRFLTDHLLGDVHFRIPEPDANLVRARVMAAHAEAQWHTLSEFTDAVERLAP